MKHNQSMPVITSLLLLQADKGKQGITLEFPLESWVHASRQCPWLRIVVRMHHLQCQAEVT